jgi:hypothetical protein
MQEHRKSSINQWAHDRMHAAYWLMNAIYDRPKSVSLCVPYPQPDDEFYGYVNRTITLSDGRTVPTARNLIRTTGWMATALLAWKASQYVPRKRECASLYRAWDNDPAGADLLEQIESEWRGQWNYLVPDLPEARLRLRTFCEQVRAREEMFLGDYRAFLLAELISAPLSLKQHALWVQRHWLLADEQVQQMMHIADDGGGTK